MERGQTVPFPLARRESAVFGHPVLSQVHKHETLETACLCRLAPLRCCARVLLDFSFLSFLVTVVALLRFPPFSSSVSTSPARGSCPYTRGIVSRILVCCGAFPADDRLSVLRPLFPFEV